MTPFIGDRRVYKSLPPCGDAQAPGDRGDCTENGFTSGTYYFEFVLAAFAESLETFLRFVFDCDAKNVIGTEHPLVLDAIAMVPVI